MESIEAMMASIEKRIDELEEMASSMVDRYWQQVLLFEKSNPGWENRSGLRLRCHRKGNHLRIEWTGLKWYRKNTGGFIPILKYISKGKSSHQYTLSKIFGYAKEWERPLIEETEKELALIRKESFFLNKAILSVRHAKAVSLKMDMESNIENDDPLFENDTNK